MNKEKRELKKKLNFFVLKNFKSSRKNIKIVFFEISQNISNWLQQDFGFRVATSLQWKKLHVFQLFSMCKFSLYQITTIMDLNFVVILTHTVKCLSPLLAQWRAFKGLWKFLYEYIHQQPCILVLVNEEQVRTFESCFHM